jgi:putative ABC transport system permease protein
VLRCLGARGRDIRRALTAESLTLVVAGWLIGVPVGWLLLQGMRRIALSLTDMDIPSVFPLANPPLVLAGTALLALSALALPGRRATRMRPGAALRYQ